MDRRGLHCDLSPSTFCSVSAGLSGRSPVPSRPVDTCPGVSVRHTSREERVGAYLWAPRVRSLCPKDSWKDRVTQRRWAQPPQRPLQGGAAPQGSRGGAGQDSTPDSIRASWTLQLRDKTVFISVLTQDCRGVCHSISGSNGVSSVAPSPLTLLPPAASQDRPQPQPQPWPCCSRS